MSQGVVDCLSIMENITKRLIKEFGIGKELLAYRVYASVRSVERWLGGKTPLRGYSERLEQILKREIAKRK